MRRVKGILMVLFVILVIPALGGIEGYWKILKGVLLVLAAISVAGGISYIFVKGVFMIIGEKEET